MRSQIHWYQQTRILITGNEIPVCWAHPLDISVLPTSVQLVLSSYIIHFKSFVSYSSLHKNLNISHCFTSVSFLELLISFCASGVSSASALLPEVIERPGCYRRNFCVPKNDLVPTLPWPWLLWSSYNYMT